MNCDLRRGTPVWAILVGGLIGGVLGSLLDTPDHVVYPILFFAVLGILSAIDICTRLLPNVWVGFAGGILVASLVHTTVDLGGVGALLVAFAVMGTFIMSGLMLLMHYLFPRQVGLGDIKLVVVCGGWIGAYVRADLMGFLLAFALASVVAAVVARLAKKETIPFGPVIVAATYVGSIAAF